jgi:hypothetical protein
MKEILTLLCWVAAVFALIWIVGKVGNFILRGML